MDDLARKLKNESDFNRLQKLLIQCENRPDVNFEVNDLFTVAKLCEVYRINNKPFNIYPPTAKDLLGGLSNFIRVSETVKCKSVVYHSYLVVYDEENIEGDLFFTQNLFISRLFTMWLKSNPKFIEYLKKCYNILNSNCGNKTSVNEYLMQLYLWNMIQRYYNNNNNNNNNNNVQNIVKKLLDNDDSSDKTWMIIVTESVYWLNWNIFVNNMLQVKILHPNTIACALDWIKHKIFSLPDDKICEIISLKIYPIIVQHPEFLRLVIFIFIKLKMEIKIKLSKVFKCMVKTIFFNGWDKIHNRRNFENLFVLSICFDKGCFISFNDTIKNVEDITEFSNHKILFLLIDQMWVCYQMKKIIKEEDTCLQILLDFFNKNSVNMIRDGKIQILEEMLHLLVIYKCKLETEETKKFLMKIIELSRNFSLDYIINNLLQLILFCTVETKFFLTNIYYLLGILNFSDAKQLEIFSLMLCLHGKQTLNNNVIGLFKNTKIFKEVKHNLKRKLVHKAFTIVYNQNNIPFNKLFFSPIEQKETISKYLSTFYRNYFK